MLQWKQTEMIAQTCSVFKPFNIIVSMLKRSFDTTGSETINYDQC